MMKLPNRDRRLPSAVLIAVAAILVLLAVFQYVWSEQAMQASTARMASLLRSSMLDWHMEFFHQFSDLCLAMRVSPDPSALEDKTNYGRRFQLWRQTAEFPELASEVYIWDLADADGFRIQRLNTQTGRFETGTWQPKLEPLREVLKARSKNFELATAASSEPETLFGPSQKQPFKVRDPGIGDAFAGWLFEASVPALVHAIPRKSPSKSKKNQSAAPSADWLVIEIDERVLRDQLAPLLTRRFFGGEYEVALLGSNGDDRVLYESDPNLGQKDSSTADAAMDVLGSRHHRQIALEWTDRNFAAEASDDEPHGGAARGGPPPLWFPLIHDTGPEPDWDLIVWHRNGSLASQAAKLRWRNLGISFGAMLLLALSMVMLAFTARRSQQLADKEINFVAAVSHELRTPLAVISSAADNLADGVVQGEEQLIRYGETIQGQARQLSDLVEQILLFAATRKGGQTYALGSLRIADIVETALRNTQGLIAHQGFRVEQAVPADLPLVAGEPTAVSQVLQNLITNAVKYGGPAKWIGIRAALSDGTAAKEVEIKVQDRGFGIEEDELQRIFEPFYRSANATAAQIHGTGLGLPLARSIAQAMGGRLTVSSRPGQGSTFTLYLRIAPNLTEPANVTERKLA
ncbi:MAG TPA: HAMP domain-containing sensor histidine kinase [Terriglobales bacterium]|jgi:signal transduction histidine kinase